MKIVARLTDVNGDKGTKVENLRWFLNLVSSYLKGGSTITLIVPGGSKIEVSKRT